MFLSAVMNQYQFRRKVKFLKYATIRPKNKFVLLRKELKILQRRKTLKWLKICSVLMISRPKTWSVFTTHFSTKANLIKNLTTYLPYHKIGYLTKKRLSQTSQIRRSLRFKIKRRRSETRKRKRPTDFRLIRKPS